MSRSKVEGTKIAQAAKDLNVTSVTIRRYIQEFDIETATDENGIKVLPVQALAELQEIRKLKEDGLTNPKVLEHLEDMRNKKAEKPEKAKAKATRVVKPTAAAAKSKSKVVVDDDEDEEEEVVVAKPAAKAKEETRAKPKGRVTKVAAKEAEDSESEGDSEESPQGFRSEGDEGGDADGDGMGIGDGDGSERSKHSLVCQTCSKTFEHMNPRLRDCLDCYRAKRKERRRGGDKHKNVIQNPIAQQVADKAQLASAQPTAAARAPREVREPREGREGREPREFREREEKVVSFAVGEPREPRETREARERVERQDRPERPERVASPAAAAMQRQAAAQNEQPTAWAQMQKPVRSYRKAIEETRLITGSLKRRLERPDLPEGERRWLEQIYAYQLILHQGWRHLAEYKSGSPSQAKVQHQAQEEAN
jgi:DNA-binding transcriptional MerR regulator